MPSTLVLFKPDCVRRGLVGECLARFERRGFPLLAAQVFFPHESLPRLAEHYREHRDKPFYEALIGMMSAGPLVACALGGRDVIAEARRLVGPYREPVPGTIRGDFATSAMDNVVHTSEDEDAAWRELRLWFPAMA
jgi:nucleoside-diphosphate kinase